MSRLEIGEVGGAQVPDSLLKKAQERAEKLKQMQAQRAAEKDAKDRENILREREQRDEVRKKEAVMAVVTPITQNQGLPAVRSAAPAAAKRLSLGGAVEKRRQSGGGAAGTPHQNSNNNNAGNQQQAQPTPNGRRGSPSALPPRPAASSSSATPSSKPVLGAAATPSSQGNAAAVPASSGKPVVGKSKCVMEVERLRRLRDERRQQQVVERVEKLEAVNNDKGQLVTLAHQRIIEEYRSTHPVSASSGETRSPTDRVRVCVRKRPLSSKERDQLKDIDIVTIDGGVGLAVVHEPKQKVDLTPFMTHHGFSFDEVFDDKTSNQQVFKHTVRPLVSYVLEEGGSAICFAYGQTGSGKTFTMSGPTDPEGARKSPGVYSQTAKAIFDRLASPEFKPRGLVVVVSFFEIYGGKLFDLLNGKRRLALHEDAAGAMQVVGLHLRSVRSVAELVAVIAEGSSARSVGTTSANDESSRSHAVFQIELRSPSGQPAGKFSLVDLAGSERGADTSNADRQTRLEGAEINKSLLALKECIRAINMGKSHTPFRASKLTSVLKDAFVGTATRMVMIACVSPGSSSSEHTLNSLRYASRVKEVKPAAQLQLGPGRAQLQPRGPADRNDSSFASTDSEYRDGQDDLDDGLDASELLEDDVDESSGGGGGGGGGAGARDFSPPFASPGKGNPPDSQNENPAAMRGTYRQLQTAVSKILDEEESLIDLHRGVLRMENDLCQDEAELLALVDTPDYDVDLYVSFMEDITQRKVKALSEYVDKLKVFKRHLKEEEEASKKINLNAFLK